MVILNHVCKLIILQPLTLFYFTVRIDDVRQRNSSFNLAHKANNCIVIEFYLSKKSYLHGSMFDSYIKQSKHF